ncbi:8870_t:CDS:2, partial [Cetraspora pellucida]
DYLDKHIGIKEHQKAMEKYTRCQSAQLNIMSSFIVQTEVNKLDIIAKMRCLVYNKPPITVAPPIFGPKKASLDTMSEFNQLSNYATYDNSKAGADFLHAIVTVIEENILAEVQRSSSWSILIDE